MLPGSFGETLLLSSQFFRSSESLSVLCLVGKLLLIWKVKLLERKQTFPGFAGKPRNFFGYLISNDNHGEGRVALDNRIVEPSLVARSQPPTQDTPVVFARHHQKASYRDVGVSRHPL